MSESNGIVEFAINLLKPRSKPEPSDIEYELIIEHLSSKKDMLRELEREGLYSGDFPSIRENYREPPSSIDRKFVLRERVFAWYFLEYDLTPSQKKLNEELLNTLMCLTTYHSLSDNTEPLEKFLQGNKNNKDLKVILNLKRGAFESTVLHAIAVARIDEYRTLEIGL